MTAIPQHLLYTDQHEWVSVEGEIATIGITDFAQHALGDLTYVEVPDVGAEFAAGDEAGALESCKAAASVYTPVSGAVLEVNEDLEDDPGLINEDCYGDGWIFKLHLSDPSELEHLKTPEQYSQIGRDEE
jgi:glycine cleavage system H protein